MAGISVSSQSQTSIGVVGLGHVGLPMAALFASKGYIVVGVDADQQRVDDVNAHRCPFHEPQVEDLLNTKNVWATTDYTQLAPCSIIFIVVPTPSRPNGSFSTLHVEAAAREIGAVIRDTSDYKVVVVTSTVMPGDTEGKIKPVLEESSGKTCGVDFGLCYNPEFIALGSVIQDLRYPDVVLIGQDKAYPRGGSELIRFWNITLGINMRHNKFVCENIYIVSIINAEIAKLALNCYVTTKITFANELALLCEHVPGADVDEVTYILGKDSRIGPKYLKGATSYGGPCFPRDVRAMQNFGRECGISFPLGHTIDMCNFYHKDRLRDLIDKYEGTVGILGMAYKCGTDITTESVGRFLTKAIEDSRCVWYYDPIAWFPGCMELQEIVDKVDVLIITLPYPEFAQIQPHAGQVIIDCWRVLPAHVAQAVGAVYIPIGRYHDGV